ncbi:MAG: alpha/beta hydrolase, partial [Dehalococcoidia bacterium]|nr:alpha/beta hydrolase [Dehalococcoidia bacterium]
MPKLKLENEFQLHYEVHGPVIGSAPAIIFAHGAGGNGLSWWQQVPAFSDQYTVITIDHRAFGPSPDIENGPGRTAFGTATSSLID